MWSQFNIQAHAICRVRFSFVLFCEILVEMNSLKRIFGKERGIVIGAIHFPPLLGYPGFPGFARASRNALYDLRAFTRGKADGVLFENNYDLPHTVEADPGTIVSMAHLGEMLRREAEIPLGVSTLWNDFKTSLALAKAFRLAFIRVPVFIDKVRASCGIIEGNAREVIAFRRALDGNKVALFTDIHVKHSKLLSRYSLIESAHRAIRAESDALILTGKWTGDAPDMKELAEVRRAVGEFPILIGSGADEKNVRALLEYANGVIVSTSLKKGGARKGEVNVKSYAQRIDAKKVKRLVARVQAKE